MTRPKRLPEGTATSTRSGHGWPDGFEVHAGCLTLADQRALLAEVEQVMALAPLYRPAMPRSGKPLSVEMTNSGPLGWVTDKDGGYRYQATHPVTGAPWPPIPSLLLDLWRRFANYPVLPEACLVNLYAPTSRLGSHVDSDEAATWAPVLSVSLGADAIFHIGGARRSDAKSRLLLHSGDVVVLGGAARRCYHGVDRILPETGTLLAPGHRLNLTLRRVTLPA
jgi:alkylated DNA repair protein (DNA oxidative demethylase)